MESLFVYIVQPYLIEFIFSANTEELVLDTLNHNYPISFVFSAYGYTIIPKFFFKIKLMYLSDAKIFLSVFETSYI